MRWLFVGCLVVSLAMVGGAYYWRAYHPETSVGVTMGGSRQMNDNAGKAVLMTVTEKAPSPRQDWAMIISVASSIISAAGAMAQVWLTHRAMPSKT